jgi:hypothetical protein
LIFFIDNSGRRSYAHLKHKKAIYLLALPSGLLPDRSPKRDLRIGRKKSGVRARNACSCSWGKDGVEDARPLVFRTLGNSFVEATQPDGFA